MVGSAIVIGGGLAGGAVATRLARAGHGVTVLERETGPHEKVCGEFLSVEACEDLASLGLPPERLGGVPIDRVRVHRGRHTVEARLPFLAHGLSRRVLDEALLETAAYAGAEVVRGVRVTGIQGSTVLTSDQNRESNAILLATGKHDMRAMPRAAPSTKDGYVGFKMHWRLPTPALAELDRSIDLMLLGTGYAGLQRVGARDANLCLVVQRSQLTRVGGTWEALLADLMPQPALARLLGSAQPLFAKPLAIANLPYGYVLSGEQDGPEEVWRLGDQAAMTASLSGDGMSVALRSARLAAQSLIQGKTATQFHRQLARHVGPQVRMAMRMQRLSERPIALAAGVLAARLWPGLLTQGAKATRLPSLGGA